MRLGARFSGRWRRQLARCVIGMALVGVASAVAGTGPAGATSPASKSLWAVTRDRTGHLHVVRGLDASVAAMDSRLGRTSTAVVSMEQAEPVRVLQTNDSLRPQQWALNAVPYERAWSVTSGAGVTVAVIDTGVRATHQDLAGSIVPGIDLAADRAQYDPAGHGEVDPAGHGTHVAGIIVAHANNRIGIAGAAPGAKVMPIRVLDANGSGSTADVATGIIYAADHGARVINLSLGTPSASTGMEEAIQYARSKGVVTVAAAGNSYGAGDPAIYPAAFPEAIAVGAVDSSLHHAPYSETGSYVDLVAPGDLIWSTYGAGNTQYALMSGTSMATPYVAAAAALVISANRGLDPAGVTNALESGATDLGARGRDNTFGAGLVNPIGALRHGSAVHVDSGSNGNGYWVVTIDGHVYGYGRAPSYGDLSHRRLSAPIVAAARTPSGRGYWLVAADGAVFSFGDARYLGSMAGRHLNSPIVGMAAMPNGYGYILLGRDGGIFTFGNAHFYGSTGNLRLNAPVLDLTLTADGRGYWFVAADGGVFSYGDARFHGSTASTRLAKPVKSMTAAANGSGYWMVADDGGIFSFGVPFQGSLPLARVLYGWPYVSSMRMRSLPDNRGYYLLGLNGTVWSFGDARYFGSAPPSFAVDLMQAP